MVPEDIIANILYRLPVKSIIRFRCVCKAWQSLITSHHLIKMHLNRPDKYNHHNYILWSPSYIVLLHYEESSSRIDNTVLNLPLGICNNFAIAGSCNGLLCLKTRNNTILLWNPATKEDKKLPVPYFFKAQRHMVGFGYDFSQDDYKVVIIRTKGRGFVSGTRANVYSLKTNSWKMIGDVPLHIWPILHNFFAHKPATFVNGALYWLVIGSDLARAGESVYGSARAHARFTIIHFDLVNEKFRSVPLPFQEFKKIELKLWVLRECLCIVRINSLGPFEIWVSKEDGGIELTWSKLMTVPRSLESLDLQPVSSTKNGHVLMIGWCTITVRTKYYSYNPEDETFKELLYEGAYRPGYWSDAYAESLVSPNGFGGRELDSIGGRLKKRHRRMTRSG